MRLLQQKTCFHKTKKKLNQWDETGTRLSQKFSSKTRPRLDKFQNQVRDRDETESLGTFSLETETRPRLSSFTENIVWILGFFIIISPNISETVQDVISNL